MLTYYMSKYLLKAVGGKNAATIVVEGVEDEHIKEAAEATKGFSGELFRSRWRIHTRVDVIGCCSLETLLICGTDVLTFCFLRRFPFMVWLVCELFVPERHASAAHR